MSTTKKIRALIKKIWSFISLSNQALLFELSGYLAYAMLLAFFPFLIFLVALSNVILPPDLIDQALQQIYTSAPREVAHTLVPIIEEVTHLDHTKILTFSLLGTLWIASSGVDALRIGLNRAYQCHETRSYIHCKLISLVYVILLSLTMMVIFPSAVLLPLALKVFHIHLGFFEGILRSVLTGSLFALIWAFTYSHLPNQKIPLLQHLFGATIAAFVWLGLAGLFSTYLLYFNRYSVIYGSLSGVIITLLFFQLSAYIVLLGAQMNAFRLGMVQNHVS